MTTVPTPPTPAAVQVVRDAVRAALLLEASSETAWRWDPAYDASDVLAAVDRHRVVPLLATYAGRLGLPEDVAGPLRRRRDAQRLGGVPLLGETERVRAILEGAGVRWLVVKGAALAALTTGDHTSRGTGDIDVFIHPDDVADVHARLLAAGWEADPTAPRPGTGRDWRHHHAHHYEVALLGPVVVDLHWHLHPARGGGAPFDACHARQVEVALGPVAVPTLAPTDALVHTSAHAGRDEFRTLRSLVDVHRLLRLTPPTPDPTVRRAIAVADACAGLPPGVEVTHPRAAPGVVRRALAAQLSATDRPGPGALPGIGVAQAVRRGARDGGAREHARVLWTHAVRIAREGRS